MVVSKYRWFNGLYLFLYKDGFTGHNCDINIDDCVNHDCLKIKYY